MPDESSTPQTESLPKPAPMPGFEHYEKRSYVSVSALNNFARCPRRFFYSQLGLSEPRSPAALTFGHSMHFALPVVLQEGHIQGLEAFREAWTKTKTPEDSAHSLGRAAMMLQNFASSSRDYVLLKPPAENPIKITDSVNDYEIPFAIDIGLPDGIPLVGRLDAMCWDRRDRGTYVLEWKTASELSDRLFQCLRRSPQMALYVVAARTFAPDTRGLKVEVLFKSRAKTPIPKTQLVTFEFDDHELKAAVDWAYWQAMSLIRCEREGYFPQNWSSCSTYPQHGIPSKVCEYHLMCEQADWRTAIGAFEIHKRPPFILEPTVKESDKYGD